MMNKLRNLVKVISQLSPKSITISLFITLIKTMSILVGVILPAMIIELIQREAGWPAVGLVIIGYCVLSFLMESTEKPLSLLATAYEYTMNNLAALKIGQKGMKIDYGHWESAKGLERQYKASVGSWEFMGLGTVIFENLLGALITFFTMVYIIGQVELWVLVVIIGLMLVNMHLEKNNATVQYQIDERIAQVMKRSKYDTELLHHLESAKEIRLYHAEDFICTKYRQSSLEVLKAKEEKLKANLKTRCLMYLVTFIQSLLVYIIAVWQYAVGTISIGYFLLFYNAIRSLADAINTIFSALVDIQNALTYYKDYQDYMETEETNQRGKGLKINTEQPLEIIFNHVSFKYPTHENYTLQNVSLTISPGKKIALVGENGSGKTTLIKLLMRLYEVTEGEILLNGVNVRDYDYDEYVKLMAPVFQDFVLHAYSIRDNLTFGECSQDTRVLALIHKVGLKEVIERLPQGLDTFVSKQISDSGVEFSGGEKQKLAIVRGFFKNTCFNVLDEPTAALDPLAERDIFCLFDEFVNNKTGIYISHRMPSVKMADEIFVLDKGRIIEHGSMDELLKQNGKFAEFYGMQKTFYL